MKVALLAALLLVTSAISVQAFRLDEVQAPVKADEIQAPQSEQIQAPVRAEAPRP